MSINTSTKEQINFYITELDRLLSYPGTRDLDITSRVERVEDAHRKMNTVLERASGELSAKEAGQSALNARFAKGVFWDQPINLVKNGDFEYSWNAAVPPPEWTAVGSPTVYPATLTLVGGDKVSARAVHIESLVAGEGIQQNVVAVPLTPYSISFWYYSYTSTSYGLVRVYEYPSGTISDLKLDKFVGVVDRASGLHVPALSFVTQSDTTSFDVRLLSSGTAGQKKAEYTHVMVTKGASEYRYRKQVQDESHRCESVRFDVSQTSHGFVVGQPIYRDVSGAWELADRDTDDYTADAIVAEVADADNFTALVTGKLTLTTAEWDAVTGGSGGLVDGNHYWLSSTTGGLTSSQPGSGIAQCVLTALSSTVALVAIGEPFLIGSGSGSGGGSSYFPSGW